VIRIVLDGPLTVVEFARPEKRNALTVAMIDDARAGIESAVRSRAVVLAGQGPAFSTGFDLSSVAGDDAQLAALLRALAGLLGAIRACPCPVVCAAHGAALAGACAIAAASDVTVTDKDARLGYPVLRLGVSPAVSAPALIEAVGAGPARARMLDSGVIDGRRAVEIGLVHECAPDGDACRDRAVEIARALAEKPPHALAATKRWLNEIGGAGVHADAALRASLATAGTEEQRSMTAQWKR